MFGGWDIYTDNMYVAAKKAGVLSNEHLAALKPFLETIKPWPAVFDTVYVKKLHGENVKKGKNKRDLADQVSADIEQLQEGEGPLAPGHGVVRLHRGLPPGRATSTPRSRSSRRGSRRAIPTSCPR